MGNIAWSELIVNADGSIYHLNLFPDDIGDLIFLVGDQDRVPMVSEHLDSVHIRKSNREFVTHTGMLRGKKASVISTGIGTDNVDIVLNEIDALVNFDFDQRRYRESHKNLTFIRIGTSGTIRNEIPVDSILISKAAMEINGILPFYFPQSGIDQAFQNAINTHFISQRNWPITPFGAPCSMDLFQAFSDDQSLSGITVTCPGFYAPQGRSLRSTLSIPSMISDLCSFTYADEKCTNLEMETAAIYGMAKLLGHKAISLNAILANRATGAFSNQPSVTIKHLIGWAFEKVHKVF